MTDEPSKEALAEARELRMTWFEQAGDVDHGLGLTEFIALALDKARAEEREKLAYVEKALADLISVIDRTDDELGDLWVINSLANILYAIRNRADRI